MNSSRLEAFSDGVFAVAITLLVLQFAVPDVQSGKLLAKLLGQWPQLVTYVASFLTVGVVWVNHHTMFRNLRAVDRTIQFINLVLLLTVVLVPYPTALLGRYLNSGLDGSVAAAFYAVVMTVMAIAFQCLVAWALTHPNLLRVQSALMGAGAKVTAEYMLPRKRLGTVPSSRVRSKPAPAAICTHRSYENGCGTHGFPRSEPYSTTISVPPGFSISWTRASTGRLSRTKCNELAMTMPSSELSEIGRVKSATTTSSSVPGNFFPISAESPRIEPPSRSTAVMFAPGPSRSARARVNAPSPAPRSAHLPPLTSMPSRKRPTNSA